MRRRNIVLLQLGILLFATLLSGCAVQPADGLYALPRQSDEYYQLQSAIDGVMGHYSVYAGPLTGSNQQAVQLADLDGDGTEEALAFVRTTGEKPLKVYIFDETQEGTYENIAVIEGDGSAFDAVDYVQLDDQPGLEILLGRRLSDQILRSLSVYSYQNGDMIQRLTANYTEYTVTDLDNDDCREVFVLRTEGETGGTAELYHFRQGRIIREREAELSQGAKQVRRILSGFVSPGVPAVFVASSFGDTSIVTDIFTFRNSQFSNVATDAQSGLSAQTVRYYNVYASDIDSDGLIELPAPVALPSANAQEQTHWVIEWYNLQQNGEKLVKVTTYHDYQGGWYLEIPKNWTGQLSVSENTETFGLPAVVFSRWNGREKAPQVIFSLYTLTGEDRMAQIQDKGLLLLAEKGETAYAARLGSCGWAKTLSQGKLRTMFHFIQVDWNSGER